jgi:hypothetical protein
MPSAIRTSFISPWTRRLITCVPIHSFRGSPPKSNNEGEALLKKDRQTSLEVFWGYVHTYKFNEAVEDEVVLDLVYEARDAKQISSPLSVALRDSDVSRQRPDGKGERIIPELNFEHGRWIFVNFHYPDSPYPQSTRARHTSHD